MTTKVLVTGAGGYLGRHVVTALLERGCDVVASDLRIDGIDERATRVQANIFSGDADIAQQLGSPDVCLHMAWRDGFKHNSDAHLTDFSAHYTFLHNLMRGGVKRIAVMGTMHEVGYWEGAITEETPCAPLSKYGIAKNALRQATTLLAQEENCILQWIRAYYIVGDDAHGNSIFAKLLQAANEGKTTFPFTTGKNKYDFIDIDDLAHQIAATVLQTEVTGVINCCSGEPVSLADRVERYIRENNLNITLEYGVFPDRPYDSPAVWGDNTKIQRIVQQQ